MNDPEQAKAALRLALKGIKMVETNGFDLDVSLHHRSRQRYMELLMSVEYVHLMGVAGDVAEFGVQHGQEATVMAFGLEVYAALWRHRADSVGLPLKKLHLFDSFEGYPPIEGEVDKHAVSNRIAGYDLRGFGGLPGATPEQMAEHSSSKARRVLGNDRVVTHIGYFNDSLTKVAADLRFAMVSIDCDLYESTRTVLDFLFAGEGRIEDGAVLIFGDGWSNNRSSPKFGYRRAWRECVERRGVEFSDDGPVGGLGHKFIIHR